MRRPLVLYTSQTRTRNTSLIAFAVANYNKWLLEELRAEPGKRFTAFSNKDSVKKQVQGARQISDKLKSKQRRRNGAEN